MGFRGNWEIKPSTIIRPKKKVDQPAVSYYPNYPSSYVYNQYGNIPYNRYQSTQYQYYPASYYQRAIHSAVQGAFDWHGLNGTACLTRVFCEVSLIHQDDVISQILRLVFNSTENANYGCPEEVDCPVSLLHLLDHALSGHTT
ncbi:uncharacterized protein LOC129002142 [Macrosteles quadrilineatus]|uniref:uncharacterized protein LOC129002142 n=1 Tax=Macrosteles quadrilineatus TaxID=74068 RepID=UPI0023E13D06|nr:uncharacterized protein LOC129002142 [Macrosteles quadrilineatus]